MGSPIFFLIFFGLFVVLVVIVLTIAYLFAINDIHLDPLNWKRNLNNLFWLIENAETKAKKFWYYSLAFMLFGVIVSLPITFFGMLPSNRETNCQIQKSFWRESFNYIVTDKFVDRQNHAMKTLLVRGDKGIVENYYLNDYNRTYDQINIGDSLTKTKESNWISVFRDGAENIYEVDWGCPEN